METIEFKRTKGSKTDVLTDALLTIKGYRNFLKKNFKMSKSLEKVFSQQIDELKRERGGEK